jgi:hypothetical protein
MARKWSGFLPLNDAIKNSWDALVELQVDTIIVINLDILESKPEEHEAFPDQHTLPECARPRAQQAPIRRQRRTALEARHKH